MKILYVSTLMLLAGCMSGKDIVAVRQVKRPDKAVILRLCDDKTAIHSLLYPLSYEMKKNKDMDIRYLDNTFMCHDIRPSSGTGGCYLAPQDGNKNLSQSYKNFDGVIKYIIEDNGAIKERLDKYYKKMLSERKDTAHIPLEYFDDKFNDVIKNFFDGDSICLHFRKSKELYNIPLKVSFGQKLLSTE